MGKNCRTCCDGERLEKDSQLPKNRLFQKKADLYNDKGFDSDENNGAGLLHYEIEDGQGPEQCVPIEVTPAKQSRRKKK